MKVELTQSMAEVVRRIVQLTPDEIVNMSIEEMERHAKKVRKSNGMFRGFWCVKIPRRKRVIFSDTPPRGSMIAAHHRFSYPEEIQRKLKRIR